MNDLRRGSGRRACPATDGPQIDLNVGARARVPDWEGLDGVSYFTNSTMMDVDFLPEHLIIIGGSYIGNLGRRNSRFEW